MLKYATIVASNLSMHPDINNKQIQTYRLINFSFHALIKNGQYEIIYDKTVIDARQRIWPMYEKSSSSFLGCAVVIGKENMENPNAAITKTRLRTNPDKSFNCSGENASLFIITLYSK